MLSVTCVWFKVSVRNQNSPNKTVVWTLLRIWIRWNIKFQTWWWLWPVLLLIKTSRLSFLSKSTLTYAGFMCISFLFMWSKRYIKSHTHALSNACVAAQFYLPVSFNVQYSRVCGKDIPPRAHKHALQSSAVSRRGDAVKKKKKKK